MDSVMQSVNALPQWVQVWLVILAAMNTMSVFFLRHASGRLVFAVWVVVVAVNTWLFQSYGGLTHSMAFVHLLWIPMIILLGIAPGRVEDTKALRTWLVLLVLVNCISLAFDIIEIARWLSGSRGVIGLG